MAGRHITITDDRENLREADWKRPITSMGATETRTNPTKMRGSHQRLKQNLLAQNPILPESILYKYSKNSTPRKRRT